MKKNNFLFLGSQVSGGGVDSRLGRQGMAARLGRQRQHSVAMGWLAVGWLGAFYNVLRLFAYYLEAFRILLKLRETPTNSKP